MAAAFGDIQRDWSPGLRHPEKEKQICSRTQLVGVVIVAEVIFVMVVGWCATTAVVGVVTVTIVVFVVVFECRSTTGTLHRVIVRERKEKEKGEIKVIQRR